MPRLFIFKELAINDEVTVSGEEAHHIIRVLRCRPGEVINISDGGNVESLGVISDIDTRDIKIRFKIVEQNKQKEIRPFITLLQGLPKGEKFDWILQKNTEIGVSKFIPVITERTVVNIAPSKLKRRKERWEKIIAEAAKQSMRMDIPEIDKVMTFDSGLEEIKNHQLSIIPWEQEKKTSLKQIIRGVNKSISRIAVFIGPEGGYSVDEVERAKKFGAVPVSLGPRILRTETAAMAVCSMIMYELGDMGG